METDYTSYAKGYALLLYSSISFCLFDLHMTNFIKEDFLFLRDVWCQRSDGLRVFNGCEKGLKPSRTETCQPKCSVSHSFCNEHIVCACKNNFIPIFSSHGYLIHCLSNSNQFRNDSNDVLADTSSRGKKDPSCKYTSMIG